jgi:hypothetical protein|tara:strand:+ start:3331 stop:3528 length:198 start_codon:yes stop_codon:yes gene_type:complete
MTKTYTPDERPALAFDERKEVQAILDALNAYRYNHIDQKDVKLDEYIRKLCDELEKCEQMFNKKG